MRRALGLGIVALWLVGADCEPAPRVAWCREPQTDFAGVTDVRVFATATRFVSVQVVATGTGLGDCVEVTSTLDVPGVGSDTTRVFVRADVRGETLTTRPVYHYDGPIGAPFGGRVLVTALGRTIEAPVDIAGVPRDAPID